VPRRKQVPVSINVWELDWDAKNERHCGDNGLTPEIADEVLLNVPKFFSNKPRRTGTHAMIGPDESGQLWTIVLLPTSTLGRWRPVTGYESEDGDIILYTRALARDAKRRR
jgi:hypothetical protein